MRQLHGTKRPKVELYCCDRGPQSQRNTVRRYAALQRESRTFPGLAGVAHSFV